MTASPTLFPSQRICVVCQAAAEANTRIKPGDRSIVALNVTIYRRTRAGRQLVTTKAVNVCEPCLSLILAQRGGAETIKGRILAQAMFDRVADRYSGLCEAKTA